MKKNMRFVMQGVLAGCVAGGVMVAAVSGFAQGSATPTATPSATPSATPTGLPPLDACMLITQAEAADALGAPVTAVPGAAQCTYVANDNSGRAAAVAAPATLLPRDAFASGAQQVATALGAELRTLTGVGDQSFVILGTTLAEGIGAEGRPNAHRDPHVAARHGRSAGRRPREHVAHGVLPGLTRRQPRHGRPHTT